MESVIGCPRKWRHHKRWPYHEFLGDAGWRAKDYNANNSYLRTTPVRLSDLPKGAPAVVDRVEDAHVSDPIAQRLRDLGFVDGEPVQVVAVGPMGGDPLLVQIGFTRFALRRAEAHRVSVRSELAAA
jgi:ferrous iron transport protein A